MADDVTFQSATLATPPDGTVVSTDDVGGKQVQRMKLMDGTDAGSTMAKVSSEGNLQTITPNRTASGTLGALNDAVTIDTDGMAVVWFTFENVASLNADLYVELYDGATWVYDVTQWNSQNGFTFTADPFDEQTYVATQCAGATQARLRVATYVSGSATGIAHAAMGGSPPRPNPVGVYASNLGQGIEGGGGTEAQALRVTIASDSTGVLSVDDNGGTLTVDGTVTANLAAGTNNIGDVDVLSIAAGDNNIGNVDIVTMPSPLSTAGHGTAAAALRVELPTDGTGVIATVGTITNAVTVNAHAVTNAGTFATQVDGAALTALQKIDDPVQVLGTDTYTEATSSGMTMGAVRRDADTTLVGTTNEFGPLQMDANGRLKVEAFSGETLPVSLTSTTVTGTVAVTQSGTWDEVGINDSGNSITVDQPTGTNLHTVVDTLPALVAGTANIGDVDVLTMPNVTLAAGTNTNEVVGDIAHDIGVGGNPVLIAGAAQDMDDTAPPNRVSAESDTTRFATDRDGALFAHPHGPQIWSYHEDSSSALTDAEVHAAPAAGLSLYVTDIIVSTGAATALNVFFEEGSTKKLGPYYLEAVAGRGLAIHFMTPKKMTAATALTVTTSAAIAHAIDVTGFIGAG